jgi:tripartite-type tricarboxylate transporter receptor subunit TctC
MHRTASGGLGILFAAAASVAGSLRPAGDAAAQRGCRSGPVRLIAPCAPGGSGAFTARAVAQNRTGARMRWHKAIRDAGLRADAAQ